MFGKGNKHRVVVLDCGIKHNMIRCLIEVGFNLKKFSQLGVQDKWTYIFAFLLEFFNILYHLLFSPLWFQFSSVLLIPTKNYKTGYKNQTQCKLRGYNGRPRRDHGPAYLGSPIEMYKIRYFLGMYRISIRYPVSAGYLTIRYYPDPVK